MSQSMSWYPSLKVDSDGSGLVSQAGAVALLQTAASLGVDRALSVALAPWRKSQAVHDPGKIVLDLATSIGVGGDCAADVAMLRCSPGVFGSVASDPCHERSRRWLPMRRRYWRPSLLRVRVLGRQRGPARVNTLPITGSMPSAR